ncbi:hypothetical protein [Aquibium oceanicum]|uniref:Uncharacterized protein n=1 Tax=Aquibium oceanicum TaxID=1670800 RepID=A0A1L3SLY5_9HYPH|nr:hypothetical protein [Aquibium oceanicum]APH70419.1 hypothetical protein BSQ44_02760 [Aquibium oceanicum]
MNMMSRGFAGEGKPLSAIDEPESTIRFATTCGATVTIDVSEGSRESQEQVLVRAKEAVKQLAAAFEAADAERKRSEMRRPNETDAGALFRSWAYR